jgi:hypothetical protein
VGRPSEPIQLPLTREQQEIIRRLSGQFAQVLEITPHSQDAAEGDGKSLHFRWRLSTASGIPRQVWEGDEDEAAKAPPSDEATPDR